MLVSKKFIQSALNDYLEQLVDDSNSQNLKLVNENLKSEVERVQNDIIELAQSNYDELQPKFEKTEQVIKKIDKLKLKINELKSELDQQEGLLKNLTEIEEYKKLIDHMELTNKMISTIKQIQEFDINLKGLQSGIDTKNYNACNDSLGKLCKTIEESEFFKTTTPHNEAHPTKEENEIHIINELKENFAIQRERLWYELNQEWDKMIEITEPSEPSSSLFKLTISSKISQEYLNQLNQFSLYKINLNMTHLKPLAQLTHNHHNSAIISFVYLSKMKQFSKKFLHLCTVYIINELSDHKLVNQIEIADTNDAKELKFKQIRIDESEDESVNSSKLLQFKLKQIEMLMQFLHDNLFKYYAILYDDDLNQTKLKLMGIFSDLVLNDFVKLIYEQLIINIIPLNSYSCGIESEICEHVAKFEGMLESVEFLKQNDGSSVFKSFVSNVEELYVRKKCKSIMEKARELMKRQDLMLDAVRVDERSFDFSQIKNFSKKYQPSKDVLIEKLISLDENIPNRTELDKIGLLKMPPCSISQLVKQILELIYATLNEAYKMSKLNSSVKNVSLLCMVGRNLFDLYASVVPTFHANSLREMPFLSALAHNDFTYLAFNCLTLTHQYKEMFSSLRRKSSSTKSSELSYFDLDELVSSFSCLDLIPKLCSIGFDLLYKQFEKQTQNLMQFLNEDTNGLKDLSEGNNYELFKRALEKCKAQLNSISSIWHDVLPECLYNKIMGQLLELICNDLLKSCIKLEDIASDDASCLHSAFAVIEDYVYGFYSKRDGLELVEMKAIGELNASKHIKSWHKFKYMLKLLKANLQEIVDLWSEGKGPLAMHYEADEVRHLIKALFMITERRSAALAKIY